MNILQPPGWVSPKGYANGVAARRTMIFTGGQTGWDAPHHVRKRDIHGPNPPDPAQRARRAGSRRSRPRAPGATDLVCARPQGVQRPPDGTGPGLPRGAGPQLPGDGLRAGGSADAWARQGGDRGHGGGARLTVLASRNAARRSGQSLSITQRRPMHGADVASASLKTVLA